MPLVFIEVKKPNNREGVLPERNRIITRCRNSRFRRFINITQLMVFSNNMEYDDSPQPIEGAFYASPSYDAPIFNYFREEEEMNLADLLDDEDDAVENKVLRDNNLNAIKHSPEFISNKSPDTPTNRICTSLFSRSRLSFLLQYAFAYLNEADGLHKHVMRYPQLFATKAIKRKLDAGVRKGIIRHTQGSGNPGRQLGFSLFEGNSGHGQLLHKRDGVTKITVTDPYIRLFYQMRNFMEFLETVVKHKAPDEEVAVHLVTTKDEFRGEQQKENFEKMQESAAAVGVNFTWEFGGTGVIHARHIVTDNGWKISLDRGLDIFQRYEMNDAFTFANRLQQYRQCKAFEVTFIKHKRNGAEGE